MAILTDKDCWEHLGFYEQPDPVTLGVIQRTAKTAESYVIGAIGKDLNKEDPRAVQLALMALSYLYDNRDLEGKGSGQINRMTASLNLQLKFGDPNENG